MGFVLAFSPRESFHLNSGEEVLTEYLFNKKAIRHLFCKICGVESFAYGEVMPMPTLPEESMVKEGGP